MLNIVSVVVIISLFTTIIPLGAGYAPAGQITAVQGSFSTPVMINDVKTNEQGSPTAVGMPGNKIVVAWQDMRSGNEDLYASVSMDNGTTFLANKRVDDSTGTSRQVDVAIAVTKNGTILMSWQDNRRSTYDYDIYFSKSYDGGATYTKNVKVDDSNGMLSWQERPSMAVTSNGLIYVAWTDDRTYVQRVRGAYSVNGGNTFSASSEIVSGGGTSGQTGISIVANGNRIFAAFMDNVTGTPHPYICVSTDGGATFSLPLRLDKGPDNVSQRGVSITPLPSGGVGAVWEDSRNGDWDIYASIANAQGVVSGPDYRADDDTTRAYQYGATIASDRVGNLYVAWEDERDSLYAIRFAYLKVGGRAFNASIEVSTPRPNDIQRRPAILTTDPGRVVVVWQDDRAGTYDIYASSAYFPNLFDIFLVAGWNFVSFPLVGYNYKASTLGLRTGDVVYSWNSTSGSYDRTYTVGVSPAFKDFPIYGNVGYWVYAQTAETLVLLGTIPADAQESKIKVPSGGGWAIIGFKTLNTTRRASDVPKMYNVTGGLTNVIAYDAATGQYKSYRAGLPFTDYKLMPGWAYWVWCTVDGTLGYST